MYVYKNTFISITYLLIINERNTYDKNKSRETRQHRIDMHGAIIYSITKKNTRLQFYFNVINAQPYNTTSLCELTK